MDNNADKINKVRFGAHPHADMHCDSLLHGYRSGTDSIYTGMWNADGSPRSMQSISQMAEGGQLLQFFAVFFPEQDYIDGWTTPEEGHQKLHLPSDDIFFDTCVKWLHREVEQHSDVAALARNAAEVRTNYENGKVSAVLTIEDGRFVNGDITRFAALKKIGVSAIALTWNHPNCLGWPNSDDPEIMNRPLTAFGQEAIAEMNRCRILIDVSHLNDGGFMDVARLSKAPFIASHSNCRAITSHRRNLTDEMIRIIADKGGVCGLNFCEDFVNPDSVMKDERAYTERYVQWKGKITEDVLKAAKEAFRHHDILPALPEDLAAHVLHMLNVGGEDVIAIGSDADGFDCISEINEPNKMSILFDVLQKKGLTSRQLDKFASGNVLRVMEEL